ncbi:MAG: hypothetical protein R2764_16680 [Bacteroidales bacterium]
MKKHLNLRNIAIIMVAFLVGITLSSMMGPQKQKGIVPTTINDFFLPGSQPLESGTFANPDQCDNCHGGYDINAEPAFNWRGSMMSQAQRDPLYLATLAIANSDAPRNQGIYVSDAILPKAGSKAGQNPPMVRP